MRLTFRSQFLRLSSLVLFGVSFFISIATFKKFAGFDYAKPLALYIVFLVANGVMILVYIVMQLVLVIRTLDDRWPIGDIVFGTGFLVAGLVCFYGVNVAVCNAVQHYIDGLVSHFQINRLGII